MSDNSIAKPRMSDRISLSEVIFNQAEKWFEIRPALKLAHNCVKNAFKEGINDCHLLTNEVEDWIAFKFSIISCKVAVVVVHLFSCCVGACPAENNPNVNRHRGNFSPHSFGANSVCLDLCAPDSCGFERELY